MTFTRATLTKLRALNLPPETVDAILEIFEEAQLSKPKKKGSAADRRDRGTRLAEDWALPAEWREWAKARGLHDLEINREAVKFKRHWLNAKGDRGIKLRWDLTWQTWVDKALEYLGRPPRDISPAGAPKPNGGPDGFDDETWRAIARRVKAGAPWNPEWGSAPDKMDCLMPAHILGECCADR